MNYISPRLEAAAASVRTEQDVRRTRAPKFGSLVRAKWDERELFARVQAAITELELALGAGAEFSDLMSSTYASTLDSLKAVIHDECCTEAALLGRLEDEQ